MSQVGVSRPPTQQSLTDKLPQIPHPLSLRGSADNLDVRGVSRAGSHMDNNHVPGSGRPLANEELTSYRAPKRSPHGPLSPSGSAGRIPSRASRVNPPLFEGPQIDAIPEDVAVIHGDSDKTKLPLFGRTAEISASRGKLESRGSMQSRTGSRLSTTSSKLRLEIDELEAILKEKIRNNFSEMKKRFKDNDPDQKGNVSRDALFRILVTMLGCPMNPLQFRRLTERLGLGDRQIINHIDFFSALRGHSAGEHPRWMDPIQRQQMDRACLSAGHVHALLVEKARQRVKDVADLIPQMNPDGTGHILRPEFRNVLNRMGFPMEDSEFEKLWQKYDPHNSGTVNGEKLMKSFGISILNDGRGPVHAEGMLEASPEERRAAALKKHAEARQRSINIEKFLKSKFREGCIEMRGMFETEDPDRSGSVTHDSFLKVLAEAGLNLEKDHLAEFLSRCSIQPTRTHVPYREFLHRFQDRSDDGMAHTILTNPKHSYHHAGSPTQGSSLGVLESQLINMFQRDFLALLGTFHNIDKLGEDAIPQEAFRAAIESRFHLELTDEQFESLIDQVPLNDEGAVKYADFMAQFDTKGRSRSLFSEPAVKKYKSIGPLPREPSPPAPADLGLLAEVEQEVEAEPESNCLVIHEDTKNGIKVRRSPQELFRIIKEIMRKNYQMVEQIFYDMDEMNTGRLTQESMYQLFSKFNIEPEISRGEVRDLWKTFITNQDKTLDFLQFTRHFGYSLKSAAFPNAKICPPIRGDSDCLVRSRKLNCAADMLQDNLRAKIDYMWDDLRQEFQELDPYNTSFVMADEFRNVLSELCVHLTQHELDTIVKKFDVNGDGRISYVEFLKPFVQKKQLWRIGNNMSRIVAHPDLNGNVMENKTIQAILTKIRVKMANDWKSLRRSFKKADAKNTGSVPLTDLKATLKAANVEMTEEEIYQIMSHFDTGLSGKIEYGRFLNEAFQLNSQNGMKKSIL